jgi:hypothetical protein
MYRIEIDIEEKVLLQVLTFLTGLGEAQKLRKVSTPRLRVGQKKPSVRAQSIKPLRKQLTIKDLLEEQMPVLTTRAEMETLFAQLNIEQSSEVLLADLKAHK